MDRMPLRVIAVDLDKGRDTGKTTALVRFRAASKVDTDAVCQYQGAGILVVAHHPRMLTGRDKNPAALLPGNNRLPHLDLLCNSLLAASRTTRSSQSCIESPALARASCASRFASSLTPSSWP